MATKRAPLCGLSVVFIITGVIVGLTFNDSIMPKPIPPPTKNTICEQIGVAKMVPFPVRPPRNIFTTPSPTPVDYMFRNGTIAASRSQAGLKLAFTMKGLDPDTAGTWFVHDRGEGCELIEQKYVPEVGKALTKVGSWTANSAGIATGELDVLGFTGNLLDKSIVVRANDNKTNIGCGVITQTRDFILHCTPSCTYLNLKDGARGVPDSQGKGKCCEPYRQAPKFTTKDGDTTCRCLYYSGIHTSEYPSIISDTPCLDTKVPPLK